MQPDSVSSTARLIARAMILNAHEADTQPLVGSEVSNLSQAFLKDFSWADHNFSSLVKVPGFSTLIFALERFIKPGLSAHYALRKQYIESLVLERLDRGEYHQVVILGCGFDTLALRIHNRYPNVGFFEIDSPALIARKRAVTTNSGSQHQNVHFIDLDSNGSIHSMLGNTPAFDHSAPTLFVIEGVLMYLQHDEVSKLFHELGTCDSEVGVIFTFLQPIGAYARDDRPPAEKMADRWLAHKGEPYRWSVTPSDLEILCEKVGLRLGAIVCPRERLSDLGLRLSSRRGTVLPRDEFVADARFNR
jgi:methyltransferase (TIGR00027 family)